MSKGRDKDPSTITSCSLSLSKLTYKVSPGLAVGAVKCDAFHGALGFHSAKRFLKVREQEVCLHSHIVYIYIGVFIFIFFMFLFFLNFNNL